MLLTKVVSSLGEPGFGLDELHSCLPGGGPSLWLVLGEGRGSGKEERRFSVKYFIILSTWRRFKT